MHGSPVWLFRATARQARRLAQHRPPAFAIGVELHFAFAVENHNWRATRDENRPLRQPRMIRIAPALNTTKSEIEEALKILDASFAALSV